MDMQKRFLSLWDRTIGTGADSAWQALEPGLGDPARKYHNWTHIQALLTALDGVRDVAEFAHVRRDEVELAIFFHDAVYDPLATDNEARSADLFVEAAGAKPLIGADGVRKVAAMIHATASHAPVADITTRLLLDLDLGILASQRAAYDRYAANVRAEYSAVPDDKWRAGRPAVLQRFLQRERIFQTRHFKDLLEARARQNLAREIADLGS